MGIERQTPKKLSGENEEGVFRNYATQFQTFLHNNFPSDFEYKLYQARPFLIASIIAWPAFWLYRGFEWRSHRQTVALPNYINRTYTQAKCIQLGIVALCLLDAFARNRKNSS